ncbi:uncharacterized protein LOC126902228 [Daktulosphaira vitifoliae]|uniref:uncharacterized protein LOC126897858 n=1 Tax=Daktulosphaira vitifoliae TaxID=58002 RepID=UPI0021A9B1FF|nr:uncharacterized protein LOC126897858 [Daktulosphaira vitifoliae]XP_050535231.1 uncharacterized protein LOC126902228 [Daktulosphaira vitifoliae]
MKFQFILAVYTAYLFMPILYAQNNIQSIENGLEKYKVAFEKEKDHFDRINKDKLSIIMNQFELPYTNDELTTAVELFGYDSEHMSQEDFLTLIEIKLDFQKIIDEKKVIDKEDFRNFWKKYLGIQLSDDFINSYFDDASHRYDNETITYEQFLKCIMTYQYLCFENCY